MSWNPTKRWAAELWTQADSGLYVHDNMTLMHRVHQSFVGAFANAVTATTFAPTLINVAGCLPYTPDFNGTLSLWVVMNYLSTVSGSPTKMWVFAGDSGGSGNSFPATVAAGSQHVGYFEHAITSGANPNLIVAAGVDAGSISVDISVIAWVLAH